MIDLSSTSELLPPLYAQWVDELLEGSIPRESRATCDDCAMCAHGEEQQGPQTDYFDPVIKCCTYVPVLHNFLTGRILSDDDPAAALGRSTVEKRIKEGVAVTPLGLGQPPVFSLLYESSDTAFGRSRNLRCPHYIEDGGRCGVWRHRESTCATWFCKHIRGSVGYAFWHQSLHQLLMAVENELAHWAVLELDPGDEALRRLLTDESKARSKPVTGEAIDNRVDPESYAKLWGDWLGREGEFFVECAGLVNPLSWDDVLAVTGSEVRGWARLTKDAYRRMTSDEVPPALKVGAMHLVKITRDMTRVSSYSSFDPVDIPSPVMESLHFFDGRPTDDAIAAIAGEKGIRLDPSLVRKMVDFALLVPPEQ
jgi:Fe-S-cluster containining protein